MDEMQLPNKGIVKEKKKAENPRASKGLSTIHSIETIFNMTDETIKSLKLF